jgi:hypothetical protein
MLLHEFMNTQKTLNNVNTITLYPVSLMAATMLVKHVISNAKLPKIAQQQEHATHIQTNVSQEVIIAVTLIHQLILMAHHLLVYPMSVTQVEYALKAAKMTVIAPMSMNAKIIFVIESN